MRMDLYGRWKWYGITPVEMVSNSIGAPNLVSLCFPPVSDNLQNLPALASGFMDGI